MFIRIEIPGIRVRKLNAGTQRAQFPVVGLRCGCSASRDFGENALFLEKCPFAESRTGAYQSTIHLSTLAET
jgi:hypothetical protein